MKTILLLILVLMAMFSATVMAGAGDEYYNGEDGDQPGIGVDIGPGEQNDEMPQTDRTRNKDR